MGAKLFRADGQDEANFAKAPKTGHVLFP